MWLILSVTFITVLSQNPGGRANPIPNGTAALLSVVLPGTGQIVNGAGGRGEGFLWADGIMWTLWAGFSWYRTSKEQDARLIARRYAGADISIPDPRYYRELERYDNADEYNEDIRREARELYPDDPDAQRRYYESRGYFGDFQWNWTPDSARVYSYWQTRRAARAAGMTASFLAAGLVLNRLISMFDCLFFLPESKLSSRVEVIPKLIDPGIGFQWRF